MLEIKFTPTFIRQFKKLEKELKEEVKEKIKEFRDKNNHKKLKVHKLHAELKDFWSCSVNYKIRIVFYWNDKKTVWLEAIGGHDIYK